MAEESKKKPKVIRVGKLVIQADEVIIQHEPKEEHHSTISDSPVHQPNFNQSVARDFWGFPIRNAVPQEVEPAPEEVKKEEE
ncbi:hypothetical protein [Sporolactobacillus laevolacticus]|uniref:hypothetical protein n=1 Tax=Sporolactobacillus laevolacticus TaxID=33018 RepID=UPI0025B5A9BC|nr:hypothetical protein [Sporolactobacillus laevolacticus]MDN3954174.1 hypothetical protein [Sporolactobacillus laevolacticus]